MGTTTKIGFITLGLALLMTAGCKKDSNILISKMTASINGDSWASTGQVTVKNDKGFVITGTQINNSLETSTLVLKINGFTTGTYNVISTTNSCLATYTPKVTDATDSYISVTGTITLTEVNTSDKTISGTFEFYCTNLSIQIAQITNGRFTGLKYTVTSDD